MLARLKLLPVTIVAAMLLLTLKVGYIWQGADNLFGSVTAASAEGDKGAASASGADAPLTPEMTGDGAPLESASSNPAGIDVTSLSPAEVELLEQLAERRKELEGRTRDLEMREQLLAATEQRVDAKIGELKKLQQTIEGMFANADAEQETQIKSLVKMYERMKPKDAARIFDRLDMTVLLQVVERMKEAKAAPILAKMDVDKAKTVTLELAHRRNLPEKLK
ncbi:MAG: MotE family protein [Alphaproteobacteria bacterium]